MQSNKEPQAGDFYLHFKNKLYQVITIATHSETNESLVIYQALYGDYGVYARPIDMFLSEVDHEKYPEVKQKYRFQYITREQLSNLNKLPVKGDIINSTNELEKTCKSEKKQMTLMDFLDAKSIREKMDILSEMHQDIDDVTIDNIAVCLDYVPSGSTLEERYQSIYKYLDMRRFYESKR